MAIRQEFKGENACDDMLVRKALRTCEIRLGKFFAHEYLFLVFSLSRSESILRSSCFLRKSHFTDTAVDLSRLELKQVIECVDLGGRLLFFLLFLHFDRVRCVLVMFSVRRVCMCVVSRQKES